MYLCNRIKHALRTPFKIKFIPVYLLSYLPYWALYFISDVLFVVVFYLLDYRKKVVYSNIRGSFPEKSDAEIKKIVRDFYRHFCDVTVETIKFLTVSEKEIKKRFKILNPELINDLYDQGRSVIMYCAHIGNWEYMASTPLWVKHKVTTFYQPLSNGYFDDLLYVSRNGFGVQPIASAKGYKLLMDYKRKGVLTLSIIIGDQSPRRGGPKHWVNFLNRETAFLIGGGRIAHKTGQAVVFPIHTKVKRGYYEFEFVPIVGDHPAANGEEIIDKYAVQLEQAIRKQPYNWLWTHKRWKLDRANFDA